MAKRPRLLFAPEDLKDLAQQRFEHPDPRVKQRLEGFLVDQPKSNAPSSSQVGRCISFLCRVWSRVWRMIRGGSGRHSVLGAACRHERLGDCHHRQVGQQGNDGCIAAKDRCFGSEGYGPIGTRQRKVSALCLGKGLGQEFEY